MTTFLIKPEDLKGDKVTLNPKETRHALSVLRLEAGEKVDLFDGRGRRFSGVIQGPEGDRLGIRIIQELKSDFPLPVQITLAVSAIRSERMEIMIEKACELGAHTIIPIRSQRSIIKLGKDRWVSKIKRWRKIAEASCKQCGLAYVPTIEAIEDFEEVTAKAQDYDLALIPNLELEAPQLHEVMSQAQNPKKLLIFIGPEGDFSRQEVESAVRKGVRPVGLGPLVMRSETAAIYVLSVLSFFYRQSAAK